MRVRVCPQYGGPACAECLARGRGVLDGWMASECVGALGPWSERTCPWLEPPSLGFLLARCHLFPCQG